MGQNGIKKRFRGSYELKVDDRGRIKVPSKYLSALEEQYGKELYITSINGDRVLLYPLGVWEGIEQAIATMRVRSPEIEDYVSRTSFWGNEGEVDGKGRVLIPPELRTSSKLDGNVRIIGKIDHMVLWNEDEFRAKALSGEFSDEKLHQVSLMLNEIAAAGSKE
jgi:MraZ protein